MPIAPIAAEQAAAHAGGALNRLRPGHMLVIVILAVAAGFLVIKGSRSATGGGIKVAARESEALPDYTFDPPPQQPVVGPYDFTAGYIFTPHRYPRVCGTEISALINHGHATLRLPHEKDMTWLAAPPGEVSL
jgi:hypothetical protein